VLPRVGTLKRLLPRAAGDRVGQRRLNLVEGL
jgi:hypothetical protein